MKNGSKAAVGALVALLATAAQAQAQVPSFSGGAPRSQAVGAGYGAHQHDGFYLRLDLGAGYMAQSLSDVDMKISGGAGSFGVALGGAVAENLIVAGHLFTNGIVNPSISSGGTSVSATDSSSSMVGLGPQLTYYFMPNNVYVSGTLAATRLSLTNNGVTGNSEWGIGTRLALGKEWWVSDNWGLGLAGLFSWSSNKNDGSAGAPTISTWGLGVAFSATYN